MYMVKNFNMVKHTVVPQEICQFVIINHKILVNTCTKIYQKQQYAKLNYCKTKKK
jgi:hypothetical protein